MYWHHVQKYLEQEQQQKSFVTSGWESGKAKLSMETCHNDPCCCQHERFSCQNWLFQSEDTTWKCSDAKELKHLRNLMNEFLSKNMNIYWLFLAGFPCQMDLALVELMWPPVVGFLLLATGFSGRTWYLLREYWHMLYSHILHCKQNFTSAYFQV